MLWPQPRAGVGAGRHDPHGVAIHDIAGAHGALTGCSRQGARERQGSGCPCARIIPRRGRGPSLLNPDFSEGCIQPLPMGAGLGCSHSRAMFSRQAPIKVFIVDDSVLIRDRVAAMLEASAMSVVGRAATPQDATDGILAASPDVVVLDVQLEGGSGLQVLRTVRHTAPDIAAR